MSAQTAGKIIKCKAAIAWEVGKLSIEEIEVAPPKAHEVRIKIVATGVCRSDANILNGVDTSSEFPVVLGHEGAGIVESVGEGVTLVKPGDKVIPLYISQCRECGNCLSSKTNLCTKFRNTRRAGLMSDSTTRFTCKGQPIHHYLGISTFSEYTVAADISVAKIDGTAPLEKVCLIGCCIPTGYGAALNTAKVEPGSSCAVFGLGGVGLAAVMGCKAAGASRIFGIDIKKDKFTMAKLMGATECLSPEDYTKPIHEVLIEKTGGGVDYAIECSGKVDVMKSAVDACHIEQGVATIIGICAPGNTIPIAPYKLLFGFTLKGSIFGGWKSADAVPKLVSEYLNKKLKVDEFISHSLPFDKIHEAFELLHNGKSLRSVLLF